MYIECLPSKCPCRFVLLSMLSLHKMTSAEAQLAGFHDLHNSSYTLMALSPLATHRPKASKANSFVGGSTGYINASCCLKFRK